jgi:hypothetical protein
MLGYIATMGSLTSSRGAFVRMQLMRCKFIITYAETVVNRFGQEDFILVHMAENNWDVVKQARNTLGQQLLSLSVKSSLSWASISRAL